MSVTGGIVLYAVLWFLSLFLILPFGFRSQADEGEIVPGTHAGAPHDLAVKRKVILATLLSAALWALVAWIILGGIITRADLEAFGPMNG